MLPQTVADYRALQDEIYGGGRKWIVALDVLASATAWIKGLRDAGAGPCLAIGASRGTGPLPEPEWGPEPILLNVAAPTMMEGIWASQKALADLPPEAVARVEAFDPDGEAKVLGTIFDDGAPVAGRSKFGRRLPEWRALEDKVVVDAIWEELGISHAPYRIVDATEAAMGAAADELDQGLGTVWAGDARSGFHGGAEFTRWVRTLEHRTEVAARFSQFCDEARVMPFLEGIPCSIHGIVFADYILAGRPCEMLVLRQAESAELRYATAATFWDPPEDDRASMRSMVRRVGEYLRESVDFRGTFTIDGIMTADGFRPTELNPRFGGALGLLVGGLKLGLGYLDLAIMEGVDVDWNPPRLEELILDHADTNRRGRSNLVVPKPTEEMSTLGLAWNDDEFEVVDADDDSVAVQVLRGPATAGTYIRLDYVVEKTPIGPSLAPTTAAAIAAIDRHWGLDVGELRPARDVR